jgi:hypothetical protein
MLDRSLALRLNGPWATSGEDSSLFAVSIKRGSAGDVKAARALF